MFFTNIATIYIRAIMPPHIRGVPILFSSTPPGSGASAPPPGAILYRPLAWASVFGFAYAVTG